MQYVGSLEAAEKYNTTKIFEEKNSVKIMQICKILKNSVQPSWQNPADLHRFAKMENKARHFAEVLFLVGAFNNKTTRLLESLVFFLFSRQTRSDER